MPFVEVWVDEEECTGDACGSNEKLLKLEARIDAAERRLRAGDVDAALRVLMGAEQPAVSRSADLVEKYRLWKHGALPGFANYCRQSKEPGLEPH